MDHLEEYSSKGEFAFIEDETFERLRSERSFTVIDAGANRGDWSLSFQRRFPEALVFAVEAAPKTFAVLVEATAGNSKIMPLNTVLSSAPGEVTFYSHEDPMLSSVLDLEDSGEKTTRMTRSSSTIDEIVRAHSITNLRVIKIDTEGYDLEVLKGAEVSLAELSLEFLQVEFALFPKSPRHVPLNSLMEFLAPFRLFLHSVDDFGRHDCNLFGNALFVKRP